MFRKGEFIGGGKDKMVYESADNPEEVIAEYHPELRLTSSQIKSAYYLQKIKLCLFPKNFPNIRIVSSGDKNRLVTQEVITEDGHKAINVPYSKRTPETRRVAKEYSARMTCDPQRIDLQEKIKLAGLWTDGTFINFSYDPDGNLVYLDCEVGWEYLENETRMLYDPDRLRNAIEQISDDTVKNKALKYFERLEKLRKEDSDTHLRQGR